MSKIEDKFQGYRTGFVFDVIGNDFWVVLVDKFEKRPSIILNLDKRHLPKKEQKNVTIGRMVSIDIGESKTSIAFEDFRVAETVVKSAKDLYEKKLKKESKQNTVTEDVLKSNGWI